MADVSKFLQNGKTYIEEVATYLEERGLVSGKDVAIYPYQLVDYGYLVKFNDQFQPYVPEGWAYQVRGPDGAYYSDRFLLRVCNKPPNVYRRSGKNKDPELVELPKFLHVGPPKADMTHFTSTLQELVTSPVIMLHEKFSSAALAVKLLGVPSVALSGCYNWSKDRALRPSLRKVVELAQQGTKIYICFDGDLTINPNIMSAARQLKGWIDGLRPDIDVVFPVVPDNERGPGWDDWIVSRGASAAPDWLAELQKQGMEITPAMPVGWLIEAYGLSFKETKQGIEIEHTSDNYMRLLSHPEWKGWAKNIDNNIVNTDTLEYATIDHILLEYEAWLQSMVFSGRGANVRSSMVLSAVMRRLELNKCSVPHLILANLPEVSYEEATAAATKAVTEGIEVVGPMSVPHTAETLLRVARDMVGLWAVEPELSPQWLLALVGPSGSGKSNFIERLLACLTVHGCRWQPAEVPKSGSRADPTEYKRIMRDSLVAILDEYEPDEAAARVIEREFFTLSTKRQDMLRDPYSRGPAPCYLRAGIFLTTTDNNRHFIRSIKGAGAERRFIILDVKGVVMGPDGYMTSNRALLEQLSPTILRYGFQMWQQGENSSANEYSLPTVSAYMSDAGVLDRIGQIMSRTAIEDLMKADWKVGMGSGRHHEEGEKVYRFTVRMLAVYLVGGGKPLARYELRDLENVCLELGAQRREGIHKLAGGKPGRNVLEVYDWPNFVEALGARLL